MAYELTKEAQERIHQSILKHIADGTYEKRMVTTYTGPKKEERPEEENRLVEMEKMHERMRKDFEERMKKGEVPLYGVIKNPTPYWDGKEDGPISPEKKNS